MRLGELSKRDQASIVNSGSRALRQRGIALFFALIALVAIALACVALVRNVDTGNLIAGNFAFRQSSVQAGDIGVELAFAALPNIITTSLDADISHQYYATMLESRGFASPIDWSSAVDWSTVPSVSVSGNSVQYVIERLCSGALPITDVQSSCIHDQAAANGSNKMGATVFSASSAVFYRVTVRVTAQRGTMALTQAVLSY
jgi:type IV pilus assembly protein PilX